MMRTLPFSLLLLLSTSAFGMFSQASQAGKQLAAHALRLSSQPGMRYVPRSCQSSRALCFAPTRVCNKRKDENKKLEKLLEKQNLLIKISDSKKEYNFNWAISLINSCSIGSLTGAFLAIGDLSPTLSTLTLGTAITGGLVLQYRLITSPQEKMEMLQKELKKMEEDPD